MKRRTPSNFLVLGACAALSATAPTSVADATLLDDYNLHVRPGMIDELKHLDEGEFAPLPPQDDNDEDSYHRALAACTSPLTSWTTDQIRDMGYLTYKNLFENKIIQMAYVYKHYIDKTHDDEFFVNDSKTKELTRRHRDTINFWNEADIDNSIMKDDILLLSMHGSDLKDNGKLVPTIMKIFDFTATSDVLAFASKVQQIIEDLPDKYDNPLLTMNAVATRSTHNHGTFNGHDDSSRRVKDSIIIGDGVLQFLYESGYESSGPEFVHAHEFGHHLQFQMDLAVPPGAGFVHDDRRKELMADALGGYFLAHDDGGDFTMDQIGIFDQTAFATGDCSINNKDHHGTPEQRQCAAVWGASLAAPDHVPVLDPEAFVESFNSAYSDILDLHWRECTLVLESTSLDYPPEEEGEEEEEEEEPVRIEDWLNSIAEQNEKYEKQNKDKVQTEENNRQPPPYNYPNKEVGVMVTPTKEESQWQTGDEQNDDWQEKPTSSYAPNYEITGKGKPNHQEEGPSSYSWGKGNPREQQPHHNGGGATSSNHVDRGSPSQEKLDNNVLTIRDCGMPGVHCYSSSSSVFKISQVLLYMGSLIVPLLIMWG